MSVKNVINSIAVKLASNEMAIEKNLLGLLVFVISFWQEEIKKLLVLNKLYILLFDENTPHDSSKSGLLGHMTKPSQ